MKKIILKWLGLDMGGHGDVVRTVIPDDERVAGESVNHRIGIIKTINGGCVLEVGSYKVTTSGNNRILGHNEWTYEFYTVSENQKISEAVGIVLLMKGLEK
jgi:hypothetical protein